MVTMRAGEGVEVPMNLPSRIDCRRFPLSPSQGERAGMRGLFLTRLQVFSARTFRRISSHYSEGILGNNPAFQRWDRRQKPDKSRMGRLNRAIVNCPFGTYPTQCAYRTETLGYCQTSPRDER